MAHRATFILSARAQRFLFPLSKCDSGKQKQGNVAITLGVEKPLTVKDPQTVQCPVNKVISINVFTIWLPGDGVGVWLGLKFLMGAASREAVQGWLNTEKLGGGPRRQEASGEDPEQGVCKRG